LLKSFRLVVVVAGLFAGGMPAQAQTAPNWTGFYLGISGGYGWGTSTQTDSLPSMIDCGDGIFVPAGNQCPGDGSYSMRGGLFGGGLGYNFQQGAWVAGVEGDFSYASVSGHSDTCGIATPHECGSKLSALGTLRGRLGYSFGTVMPFIAGGGALGRVSAYDVSFAASGAKYLGGWTIGGGIEAQLAQNWSGKLEYLYVDLGKGELFDAAAGFPETVTFRASILRVGVNYRFGVPAPAR
jgi:outer membrane immunogenic protein